MGYIYIINYIDFILGIYWSCAPDINRLRIRYQSLTIPKGRRCHWKLPTVATVPMLNSKQPYNMIVIVIHVKNIFMGHATPC